MVTDIQRSMNDIVVEVHGDLLVDEYRCGQFGPFLGVMAVIMPDNHSARACILHVL